MMFCLASEHSDCLEHRHLSCPLPGVVRPAGWDLLAAARRLRIIQQLRPWVLPATLRRAELHDSSNFNHSRDVPARGALVPARLDLPEPEHAFGGVRPRDAREEVPLHEDGLLYLASLRGDLPTVGSNPRAELAPAAIRALDENLRAHVAALDEHLRSGILLWVDAGVCRHFWGLRGRANRHPLLLVEEEGRGAERVWKTLIGSRSKPPEAAVALVPEGPGDAGEPPPPGVAAYRFDGPATTWLSLRTKKRLSRMDLRLGALAPLGRVHPDDFAALRAAIDAGTGRWT